MAVLALTGPSVTGGAEEAADLLAERGWSKRTWSNQVSQVRKWLTFCEEEGRNPLPADEGDVLAYIGYLSLEGRVSAQSAPQYVSAVSRYHINHHFASPTLTVAVRDLLKAFAQKADRAGPIGATRTGCGAVLMKKTLDFGLATRRIAEVCFCAATIFSFIFPVPCCQRGSYLSLRHPN